MLVCRAVVEMMGGMGKPQWLRPPNGAWRVEATGRQSPAVAGPQAHHEQRAVAQHDLQRAHGPAQALCQHVLYSFGGQTN